MKERETQTKAPVAARKRSAAATTPAKKAAARKAAAPKAPTTMTVPGKRAAVIERRQKVLAYIEANPGCTLDEIAKGAKTTRTVAYNDLFLISCTGSPRLYSIRPPERSGVWRWTLIAPVVAEAISA